MSAATLPAKGPTAVVDFLRTLTPEEKDLAFAELVREAIRLFGGQEVIPVTAPDGESLGYYVPPAAAEEHLRKLLPALTPERRAITADAIANPDRTFDMAEYMAELSREDPD